MYLYINPNLSFQLKCCGIYASSDWTQVYQNGTLPKDCCSVMPLDFTECTATYASANGCLPELLTILNSNSLNLGLVALGIASLQLLAMCFACCLSRSFCNKYDSV